MKDLEAHIDLRSPEEVMRLARMGQSFPMRLSFLRVLLRRLEAEDCRPEVTFWDMDPDGFGEAVYTLELDGHALSLVAVSRALDDAARSDRVIANAWDAAFVLYDGVPDTTERARIAREAPLQEGGRFTERDLVLSRANKSVRVWSHVVETLRAGGQPDPEVLGKVGYMMRTTAVYGNGKFGIADRHLYAERQSLATPFAVEMLCVWLIRQFTFDLVEHVAGCGMARTLKRGLGVGNATGLGMAPFLVSHPRLLHNWVVARETALARARSSGPLHDAARVRLLKLHRTAAEHLAGWHVPDADAARDVENLRHDWRRLEAVIRDTDMPENVYKAAQGLGLAAQELTVSLLIELFPDRVDGLAECMSDPYGPSPAMLPDTDALAEAIEKDWAWAMRNYAGAEAQRFWYVSANKQEPRIGDRWAEEGSTLERPLDVARAVARLKADLPMRHQKTSRFLQDHPEHAFAVQRVSNLARYPYAEIRDNLISAKCRPIDMLRFKLSFFGATRFDPKSDLWTRITLAQGAPLMDELGTREEVWLDPGVPA